MSVLLVSAVFVGAVGDPVRAALANGARRASAASARAASVPTADVANVSALDWAVLAAPAASNADAGCVAAVPSPRFVRAVLALARSDRFEAFWSARASAVSARV